MADNSVDVVNHNDITVDFQPFVCLAIFEAIHDDLKHGLVKQDRYPEMNAGCDKVDI